MKGSLNAVDWDCDATAPLLHYGELVSCSGAMAELFELLRRLERSLLNVLIEGETGTGKELIARAIHAHSAMKSGPLVTVNCGAIPRDLVASELFGHRKGAFTGAVESRPGAFEAADGGTLFLDEIAELPLEQQPVLLRAIEERVIVRVGETKARNVRVRIVAATHARLQEQVRLGLFRQDLLYRLSVVHVAVPPLRERPQDIPLLANLFARRAADCELPKQVAETLAKHDWPGNVRELRHAVERFAAVGTLPRFAPLAAGGRSLSLEDFVDDVRPYRALKEELLSRFSELYLRRLLERTAGNVSLASRLSGIERSYLNKLAQRHGGFAK